MNKNIGLEAQGVQVTDMYVNVFVKVIGPERSWLRFAKVAFPAALLSDDQVNALLRQWERQTHVECETDMLF